MDVEGDRLPVGQGKVGGGRCGGKGSLAGLVSGARILRLLCQASFLTPCARVRGLLVAGFQETRWGPSWESREG